MTSLSVLYSNDFVAAILPIQNTQRNMIITHAQNIMIEDLKAAMMRLEDAVAETRAQIKKYVSRGHGRTPEVKALKKTFESDKAKVRAMSREIQRLINLSR